MTMATHCPPRSLCQLLRHFASVMVLVFSGFVTFMYINFADYARFGAVLRGAGACTATLSIDIDGVSVNLAFDNTSSVFGTALRHVPELGDAHGGLMGGSFTGRSSNARPTPSRSC